MYSGEKERNKDQTKTKPLIKSLFKFQLKRKTSVSSRNTQRNRHTHREKTVPESTESGPMNNDAKLATSCMCPNWKDEINTHAHLKAERKRKVNDKQYCMWADGSNSKHTHRERHSSYAICSKQRNMFHDQWMKHAREKLFHFFIRLLSVYTVKWRFKTLVLLRDWMRRCFDGLKFDCKLSVIWVLAIRSIFITNVKFVFACVRTRAFDSFNPSFQKWIVQQ